MLMWWAQRGGNGLAILRRLWASLTGAGVLIAAVVAMLEPPWGDATGIAAGVGLGLASIGVAFAGRRVKLDVSSEQALADSYRRVFFLSYSLVDFPYLIAFVLTFVMDQGAPLYAALPLQVIAMVLIAPFSGELRRRQQEITAQGSTLSLEEALRKMPPVRPGMAP